VRRFNKKLLFYHLIIYPNVVYNIKRIVNNKKRIKNIQFPLANMLGGGGIIKEE